jgi:hypothetical protein
VANWSGVVDFPGMPLRSFSASSNEMLSSLRMFSVKKNPPRDRSRNSWGVPRSTMTTLVMLAPMLMRATVLSLKVSG